MHLSCMDCKQVITAIESNIETVCGVGIGLIVLQILGVCISCILAGNMRRANYV